jgi:hypothetical protein
VLRLVPAIQTAAPDEKPKDGADVTVSTALNPSDATIPTTGATSSRFTVVVSAPDGAPLPDFEAAHDYASWSSKTYISEQDKEAAKRCWGHLKYTRVLDIVTPKTELDEAVPDELRAAEVSDALNPAPADLHHAARDIDTGDPLVAQLRWFCDALQKLEAVRYVGAPHAEAVVKLFADVQRKVIFPTSTRTAVGQSPEIKPGTSTRIVTNVMYAPSTGPVRVPIQFDYPTHQDMTYVYMFNVAAGSGEPVDLSTDTWRRLIREIAGVLTYFQDVAPEVYLVDLPLPVEVPPNAKDQPSSPNTKLTKLEVVDKILDEPNSAPSQDLETAIIAVVDEGKPPPATRLGFLAAIAQLLTTNQNNPDRLKEMVGTGTPEGQVHDALSHVTFVSRAEYESQLDPQEVALETKI